MTKSILIGILAGAAFFVGATFSRLLNATYPLHVYNCPKVRIVEWQRASGRDQFRPVYSDVQTVWDKTESICATGSIGGQ